MDIIQLHYEKDIQRKNSFILLRHDFKKKVEFSTEGLTPLNNPKLLILQTLSGLTSETPNQAQRVK